MDACFDDLHVAFVVEVFFVLVHVDCEALGFFMRLVKSSGIVGAKPAASSVSLMLLPVIGLTSGMAYWSRRTVPMLLVEWPSLASFMMNASTSSGWYLHQLGGRLLTGRMLCDFPFSCFGIVTPQCAPLRR